MKKKKQATKIILADRERLDKPVPENTRRYYDLKTNTVIQYF